MGSLDILPLVEAANNFAGYAGIKHGEEVLLLTENSGLIDDGVLQSLATAIVSAGGELCVLTTKQAHPKFDKTSPILEHAMNHCDVFVALTRDPVWTHSRIGVKAMLDYDVRIYAIADVKREFMLDDFTRFPNEVFWIIARKVFSAVRHGKRVRVTSDNGTDISGDVHPLHVTGVSRDIDPAPGLPGAFNVWPGGTCETHLEGDINGRIVYDQLDGFRRLIEPVILTVEHHWVTKIEGQKDAVEWLSKKAFGIKNGNYFAETSTGLNPKARIQRGLKEGSFELSRRAGTVHFGIGKSTTLGGRVWSDFHWDGLLFRADYYVDDFCLVKNGHLTILDDPEVRAAAAKYGDPDKILAYADWAD